MVNVLRGLTNDSEVLLATMQVFILEPSLDWLNYARKHFNDSEGDKPNNKATIPNPRWRKSFIKCGFIFQTNQHGYLP